MRRLFLIAALFAPLLAQAQLEWRISIKVFTNTNGALPRLPFWDLGGATLFEDLSNGVNYANTVLAGTGRGYSWRLTEIVTLAGTTAPLPAATNSWFNLPVNATTQDDLDTKAKGNAAGFLYRANAINFYYVDATSGGAGGSCAFPSENQHVIAISPNSFADVLIHEAGHFFSLVHTHNTEQYLNSDGTACTNGCDCAQRISGDDNTPETALDHQCWTNRNQLALGAYGLLYASLNADQQWRVNNTWLNIMSYHSPGVLFTDDQMDFMTDISNTTRFNVATGRTRFVDRAYAGSQDGSRANPFRTVGLGVDNAIPGDIVLIRSGNYNEPRTYGNAVTLRATRGAVSIGVP